MSGMKIKAGITLSALIGLSLLSCFAAAAQSASPLYFIKPSEVELPDGVGWGQYKRTIQPFENWTLICDENLKKKERVCNVSQTVVDATKNQVFSWSLAATAEGDPFMILRVPSKTDQNTPLKLLFSGRDKPVTVDYKGCDDTICLAMMPVGPITREHINKASDVTVSYKDMSGETVEIVVPLKGLKSAFEGIK